MVKKPKPKVKQEPKKPRIKPAIKKLNLSLSIGIFVLAILMFFLIYAPAEETKLDKIPDEWTYSDGKYSYDFRTISQLTESEGNVIVKGKITTYYHIGSDCVFCYLTDGTGQIQLRGNIAVMESYPPQCPNMNKEVYVNGAYYLKDCSCKTCNAPCDCESQFLVESVHTKEQVGDILTGLEQVEKDFCNEMNIREALQIATLSECTSEGTLKNSYMCNQNTGTWWIDLDIDKKGCNPACVINIKTKTAEINWRCTGSIN